MSDEWDFYACRVDGEPASIFLDMGVGRSAPISDFDKNAYIRVWMKTPRPDGLSSQEEYDTLVAIEEALEAAFGPTDSTLYVGRNTSSGCRDFYFYTRDQDDFRASASSAMSNFSDYKTEIGVRPDENWGVYFDFLYPNSDQKQVMANRGVIEALGKNGDDCSRPRHIDHLIIVGDRTQADAIDRAVTGRGFKLKAGTPTEQADAQWWVEFEKPEAPLEIDETTVMLSRLADEHAGEYDGWGCEAVSV